MILNSFNKAEKDIVISFGNSDLLYSGNINLSSSTSVSLNLLNDATFYKYDIVKFEYTLTYSGSYTNRSVTIKTNDTDDNINININYGSSVSGATYYKKCLRIDANDLYCMYLINSAGKAYALYTAYGNTYNYFHVIDGERLLGNNFSVTRETIASGDTMTLNLKIYGYNG